MGTGMNPQRPGIEWTHPWGRRGFTWNVQGGCLAKCAWNTGDGVTECYAKTVAEKLAVKAYPQGFAHSYWHPERLEAPYKIEEPAGIFVDSMSDLLGHWVPMERIMMVMDVIWENPKHVFFLLTKNAPRIGKITETLPPNLWLGVSVPADYMYGGRLNFEQQDRMFVNALEHLMLSTANVTWVSFEPLSRPWHHLVADFDTLDWAVIGAASRGKQTFQPAPWDLRMLEERLAQSYNIPVFYKGNLDAEVRRIEYPSEKEFGYAP